LLCSLSLSFLCSTSICSSTLFFLLTPSLLLCSTSLCSYLFLLLTPSRLILGLMLG